MNRFEGLNLPQLMELMHELALPVPVSWVPATPGWWIVLAWLLAMLALTLWHWRKRYRANRYRRDAEAELTMISRRADDDPAGAAEEIAILVKRTALAAYPRQRVASQSGSEWARFLRETCRGDAGVSAAADALATAAYRPDADGRALVTPARRWIRRHRA